LIISPFAKKGYVDSTFYDVTSILKFIEYNYGLSPLSVRDAKANNMLEAFEFTLAPQKRLVLNSSAVQDEIQDRGKIRDNTGENIYKVNLVYLVVISIIPVIGLITWILSRRRTAKLDFIPR
jgi:phospholipase C